jgi:phage repressor protein C with HTH and peptisase S24 domain
MPNSIILKDLIESLGMSISAFERAIGVGSSAISKAIARESGIKSDTIDKISKTFPNVSREWLETGEGDMFVKGYVPAPSMTDGDKIRLQKAIGRDIDDRERGLIYVPIAAQAGYSRNFEDAVFVNQLQRLYIPGLPYAGDKYRYFDVEGESMEPTLEEGMQVIGEEVMQEDWQHVSDFYIYVIVKVNRVMIKRLFRKDPSTLVLISDNEEYAQEILPIQDIKELWLVKRKLDWRMTPPKRFEIKV